METSELIDDYVLKVVFKDLQVAIDDLVVDSTIWASSITF